MSSCLETSKIDFCPLPLSFVFGEIEIVVQYEPRDFLPGDELGYFHLAAMNIFVMIGELSPEFVGRAFNFFRPPPTNVIDGFENFFWRLVYRKAGGEVLIFDDSLLCPFRSWLRIGATKCQPYLAFNVANTTLLLSCRAVQASLRIVW